MAWGGQWSYPLRHRPWRDFIGQISTGQCHCSSVHFPDHITCEEKTVFSTAQYVCSVPVYSHDTHMYNLIGTTFVINWDCRLCQVHDLQCISGSGNAYTDSIEYIACDKNW